MNRYLCSSCALFLGLALAVCSKDDDGSGSSSGTPGQPNDGGATDSTGGGDDGDTGDAGDGGDTATDAGSDTGDGGDTGDTGGDGGSGTTGGDTTSGNACDPVVPGDWNACKDENGQVDNTLCEWHGTGDSVGMVGCLSAADNADANVCFISGCEDVCDCFAPPATGNATIICEDILEGGGMGCALDCSNGETCPDGMECISSLCFWPPP